MFDRDAFVQDKLTINSFVVVWFRHDVFVRDAFVALTFTIEAFVERRRVLVMFLRQVLVDKRFVTEAVSIDASMKEAFVDC